MRVRKHPERFYYSMLNSSCAFALSTNIDEPRSVKEALGMEDAGSWIKAMMMRWLHWIKTKLGTLSLFLKEKNLLVVNGCSRRNSSKWQC